MTQDQALVGALGELSAALACLEFGLLPDRTEELLARRDRLRRDLEHQAARLRDPDAPLLAVVGGVTGGGKSTIVNTLAGEPLCATGVRRPTTVAPTLVCHPDDLGWFEGRRVLPSLDRDLDPHGGAGGQRATDAMSPDRLLRVLPRPAVPAGLALVDAPDSDSVSAGNRVLAGELLDAADLWLWVTTQGKYADEDSMAMLRRARDRGASVAVAITQVDAEHLPAVAGDFRDKLAAESLAGVELFVVPRVEVAGEQLPEHAVYDLRGWLWSLAGAEQRRALRDRTLAGALDALPAEVTPLLEAVDAEHRAYRSLTAASAEQYRAAAARFADLLEQGQISMREQVLRSWVDFIGTGRFQRFLHATTDRMRQLRRQLTAPLVDRREQQLEQELRVEAVDAVTSKVREVADVAAGAAAGEWLRDPAGRALLDAHPELHRSSAGLAGRIAREVAAWERDLVALVETKGATRKVRTQVTSTVVNATAVSLMVVVFTASGGLTGAEVGIAGAGATLGQLLLEKMLGDTNVRWLVAEAKRSLLERVEEVLASERGRFSRAAADRGPDPEDRQRVAGALALVASSRT